ncbi:hypothetical protein MRX96_009300 [Rhipicephalus microplus]
MSLPAVATAVQNSGTKGCPVQPPQSCAPTKGVLLVTGRACRSRRKGEETFVRASEWQRRTHGFPLVRDSEGNARMGGR